MSPPPNTPPNPRVLVAEADPKIRAASSEILRRDGFDVTPCTDAADVLRLATDLVPALLMLDVSLPGLDWHATVRALARRRETRPVQVVLICPPDHNPTLLGTMRAGGAFGVLLRPLKRKAISATAAAALKAAQAEQAKLDAATARRPAAARRVESNGSLLARRTVCPFHDDPVPFDRYTLRGSRIVTETNAFDLTVYKSAAPGADFVNYHPLAVIVCPRCHFASVNAAYFVDPVDPNAHHHPLNAATTEAVRATAAARLAILGDAPAAFYTEARTIAQAVTAYALAIASSRLLLDTNPHTLPVEHARIGNAHLRLAHLHELLGSPPAAIDAHYRQAMPALDQAFARLAGGAVFKSAYQRIALALRFADDRTAYQYLNVLIQLDRDPALPKDDRAALQRYLPRAQRAWEDRDHHRSPLLAAA